MRTEPRIFSDGGDGSVSGVLALPDRLLHERTIVLAHGAGSDMNSAFLVFMQERLASAGYRSVRFNFPYKEKGRRLPDHAPVLERSYRSVIASVRSELATDRVVIGGRSMGGRMATHLAAAGEPVDGVALFGYPLHPAGYPEKLRSEHLPRITVPMLFVTGTRDALCDLALLRPILQTLSAPVTLHVVNDGDHSFVVRRRETGRSQAAVNDEIASETINWLMRQR